MKKIGIGIAIIGVAAVCFFGTFFVIGEPVDGKQLLTTAIVDDSKLELQVSAEGSAVALKGWKYEKEGTDLFISARKVPVSPLFSDGNYRDSIDLDGLECVYLGGQVIWEKEN